MYQASEGLKIGKTLIFLSEIFLQARMSLGKPQLNYPVLDSRASQLGIFSQVEFLQ